MTEQTQNTDGSALGSIETVSVHRVGNKANDEGMILSSEPLPLTWQVTEALTEYFKAPLDNEEFFRLFHEGELQLNEVYTYVDAIFSDPEKAHEVSVKLAKHLFSCSEHPNIKAGEFYTVFFKHCLLSGELIDAVGLFKSENKDTFLKVNASGDGFEMEADTGINIHKLDKGCLIFQAERENGYIAKVVDKTNRQAEARYWIDDFLQVRQLEDAYYQTDKVMALAKQFITKELPKQFDVEKADQADLMNRSVKFFKESENFNMDDFEAEVIVQPEVVSTFQQFRHDYELTNDMKLQDEFDISQSAVKKKGRIFKSVIKLDKNFHIYVHGNREMIERGEDADGRKFYKLFYEDEL